MRKWQLLVVFAVLGFVGGISWSYAQQRSGSPAGLTGQDYAEITQLFTRYNQASDFSDADMWLSTFADDAVFKPGEEAVVATMEGRMARAYAAAQAPQRSRVQV
jgi:hypothetical protein